MANKGEIEGDSLLSHGAPPGRDSARVQYPVHYDDHDDGDGDGHHTRGFDRLPPEPEPPQYGDGDAHADEGPRRKLQPFDGIIAPKTGWKDHKQRRTRLLICYVLLGVLGAIIIVGIVVGVIFRERALPKPDPTTVANQTGLVVMGDGSPDQPTALFFRSSNTLLQVTMDGDTDSPIHITTSAVDNSPIAGAAYYGYHENEDAEGHPDAKPPYVGYYFAYLGFDSGVNFHPRLQIQFSLDNTGSNFRQDDDIHSNATFIPHQGLSAAPGVAYNATSKQWDGGVSVFGCLDDGSLHEFAYRGKGNLTDLYAFNKTDDCTPATILRHDAASYLIRRVKGDVEDLALFAFNDAWKPSLTPNVTANGTATNETVPTADAVQRWESKSASAFKVPTGHAYCASGEMFAYQDQEGTLQYVPLAYEDNGITWGLPSPITTHQAILNGTTLACRWTKDNMRVYYQSEATALYQVDKVGSADWVENDVVLDI